MKIKDVPQEQNKTLSGNKKTIYAIDENGAYNSVASNGWKVEEIVTSQAVEEFNRLATNVLEEVHMGKSSLLKYYMYKNRMDLALLSQTTGFFKWTIKRDFTPSKFDNISEKRALIYANVLGISLKTLRHIPKV